jgi:hypothetical protein
VEGNLQAQLTARFAERGLTLQRYDGHNLVVRYDPENDKDVATGRFVSIETVSIFVRNTIASISGNEALFPGLQSIEVLFADAPTL